MMMGRVMQPAPVSVFTETPPAPDTMSEPSFAEVDLDETQRKEQIDEIDMLSRTSNEMSDIEDDNESMRF